MRPHIVLLYIQVFQSVPGDMMEALVNKLLVICKENTEEIIAVERFVRTGE